MAISTTPSNDSSKASAPAKLSIVLPTYNRASFLDQAFQSIRNQTFSDWELLVIDDGSTDTTREVVEMLAAGVPQRVQYIHQPNRGAYGARNTGLEHVRGEYVAFYDSDDHWLPHHLADSVEALDANPEVAWVYGAGQIVDFATGKVLSDSTFYVGGKPRPFLQLKSRQSGKLTIIEDAGAIRCQITSGLYCGLQKSVLRSSVFRDGTRFEADQRNEAEDQLFAIRYLAAGYKLGYFDNVHLIYRVHASNSSGSATGSSLDKRVVLIRKMIEGYEALATEVRLNREEQLALRARLSREYFWTLGYALLWQGGRRGEALRMFRRGLSLWPWDWSKWKTYLLAQARFRLRLGALPAEKAA